MSGFRGFKGLGGVELEPQLKKGMEAVVVYRFHGKSCPLIEIPASFILHVPVVVYYGILQYVGKL